MRARPPRCGARGPMCRRRSRRRRASARPRAAQPRGDGGPVPLRPGSLPQRAGAPVNGRIVAFFGAAPATPPGSQSVMSIFTVTGMVASLASAPISLLAVEIARQALVAHQQAAQREFAARLPGGWRMTAIAVEIDVGAHGSPGRHVVEGEGAVAREAAVAEPAFEPADDRHRLRAPVLRRWSSTGQEPAGAPLAAGLTAALSSRVGVARTAAGAARGSASAGGEQEGQAHDGILRVAVRT